MKASGFLLVIAMLAQGLSQPAQARKLRVDDILSMRTVRDVVLSPDGSQLVFVVEEPRDEEHSKEPANTELYLISTKGGSPRRLTSNSDRDSDPQWSPDGALIAFLSVRERTNGSQIFLLRASGSGVRQLTRHPTSVAAFDWSPSGQQIAFLATEEISPESQEELRRGDDEIVLDSFDTDQNAPHQRVWMLDLKTDQSRLVGTGNAHVHGLKWSPDTTQLLLTITDDANLDFEWTHSRLAVIDPTGGGDPTVYCATRGRLAAPGWIPDGSGISFLGASANGTEQAPSNLFICQGLGGTPVNLTREHQVTVQSYRWLPDAKSCLLTFVERNNRYLADLDTTSRQITKLSGSPQVISSRISLSHHGEFFAGIFETPSLPPDIWAGRLQGERVQMTHLNPSLEKLSYGETEEIEWKARDGWDITGILVKPVGYRPGQPHPMIVHVHGGPESADLNGFQISWAQLFAAHGYAVFLPNYRGSIGRGVAYTIANHGDRGGKDFLDILDGVDALVERGIADPQRLGIGGWSYGGFMSAWAVTQTQRFKAAVVGVGITNWYSLMGMAPVPMWNAEVHFLVWPYDHPHAYWRFSSVLQVKNVKTPTLMLWGEVDPLIPPAQGREFFRGLRYYDVPSELVIYPREGHGLREPLHRKDAYRRVLKWYDRYVKGVD